MAKDIKKQTEIFIKDLHARESMRLGWYRQLATSEKMQLLRVRKAQHQAFLNDLLRKRDLQPAWYARWFYYVGHLFGWITAFLPRSWSEKIEQTLEYWILQRYEKYLLSLRLVQDLRSMIEALQLAKLNHNEPGADVLALLETFVQQQRQLLPPTPNSNTVGMQ